MSVCDEATFFVSQNYDDNNILGVLFSLLISLMNRLFFLANSKYQITSPSAVSECNIIRGVSLKVSQSHNLLVNARGLLRGQEGMRLTMPREL